MRQTVNQSTSKRIESLSISPEQTLNRTGILVLGLVLGPDCLVVIHFGFGLVNPVPVMLVLGLGPVLKDSLRTGDKSLVLALALGVKSLVLALALRLSPWNSP